MNELLIKIISLLIILKSVNCAQELNQQKTTTDSAITPDRSEQILSRRRRYLTFPEGSSLQLIYDQTLPIVGYELLFTIGVTVALAWELPSEPLYKITQKIKENLENGGIDPAGKRKDSNTTYLNYVGGSNGIDKDDTLKNKYYYKIQSPTVSQSSILSHQDGGYYNPKISTINYNTNHNKYYNNLTPNKSATSNKFDYYFNGNTNYNSNKYSNQLNKYSSNYYAPTSNKWNRNDITNVINRIAQTFSSKTQTSKKQQQTPSPSGYKKKRVYPVFGKRSIDEQIKREEEKFFLNHHRTTRQSLYTKIEKYLKSHNKDGRACVLKTLCETGQKQHEKGTGTFVAEIMRAIFSLPKLNKHHHDDDAEENGRINENIHRMYDEAHGSDQNCQKLYPECKDSLWTANFIN